LRKKVRVPEGKRMLDFENNIPPSKEEDLTIKRKTRKAFFCSLWIAWW